MSGVLTFSMPWIAAISPYAVITAQVDQTYNQYKHLKKRSLFEKNMPVYRLRKKHPLLQAMRGIVACIVIPHNYQFVRTWTIPSESAVYLTAVGSILTIGVSILTTGYDDYRL